MSENPREMWACGPVFCTKCNYEDEDDVHIWLAGTEPIECPECKEMSCVPYFYAPGLAEPSEAPEKEEE